jgi:hypothetical protein
MVCSFWAKWAVIWTLSGLYIVGYPQEKEGERERRLIPSWAFVSLD